MEPQVVPNEGLRQRTAHTAAHDTTPLLAKSSLPAEPAGTAAEDEGPLGKTPDGTGEH